MNRSANEVVLMPKSKRIAVAAYSSEKEGRYLERLVPDSNRMLDVYAGTIQPGGGQNPEEPSQHEGEELCYVLSGKLNFIIDGKNYLVEAGDLIYYPSNFKHSFRNLGPELSTAIWVEMMVGDPPV